MLCAFTAFDAVGHSSITGLGGSYNMEKKSNICPAWYLHFLDDFFFPEEAVESKSQRYITSLSYVVW